MDADDVEGQMHHEFRSCPEHAGAPECRSDGKAPLCRTEIRFELPHLKETDGTVEAVDGTAVRLKVDSLCVHGDTPGAVAMAHAVRSALTAAGIHVEPFV